MVLLSRQSSANSLTEDSTASGMSFVRQRKSTSVSCKLLEHIISKHIMKHLERHRILTPLNYGFRSGYSCETLILDKDMEISFERTDYLKTHLILNTIYHLETIANENYTISYQC
jgi:hypothetical protein